MCVIISLKAGEVKMDIKISEVIEEIKRNELDFLPDDGEAKDNFMAVMLYAMLNS